MEELRLSDTSQDWVGGQCQRPKKGELGLAGATGQHCSKEFGDGGSVSSARGSQKGRRQTCRSMSERHER